MTSSIESAAASILTSKKSYDLNERVQQIYDESGSTIWFNNVETEQPEYGVDKGNGDLIWSTTGYKAWRTRLKAFGTDISKIKNFDQLRPYARLHRRNEIDRHQTNLQITASSDPKKSERLAATAFLSLINGDAQEVRDAAVAAYHQFNKLSAV